MKKTGLILSGGGARGAYEAGVLHYVRTQISPSLRKQVFDILCGCSVGAINTSFLASTAHEPLRQTHALLDLWSTIRAQDIYDNTASSFLNLLGQSLTGIMTNLTRMSFLDSQKSDHFQALLNTGPLRKFIKKKVRWEKISQNIRKSFVESVGFISTQQRTGRPVVFLQTRSTYTPSSRFDFIKGVLQPEHAMASAAIPLVFPSIKIKNHYYVDGGVRMNTPLSPAIHLGARRLFIVGLHADQNWSSHIDSPSTPPTLGEHLGKLFHSFLLDHLKTDLMQLQKINKLIDTSESIYGKNFCKKINRKLKPTLNKIETLLIHPSIPISEVFATWYAKKENKAKMGRMEKFLMRILDIQPEVSADLLSYLAFESDYMKDLIQLGFKDTAQKHDMIEDFFSRKSS